MASEYNQARKKAYGEQTDETLRLVTAIRQAVAQFVEGIMLRIGMHLKSPSSQNQQAIERAISEEEESLTVSIEQHLDDSRSGAFDQILKFWEDAGLLFSLALGTTAAAAVAAARFQQPKISMVGVWDTLSPVHWRTLLRQYSHSGAAEVSAIVKTALAEGVSADELAQRLRRYVVGSEPFARAFGGTKIDLRRIPASLRGSAQQMVFNSQRIAYSEIQNARAEAEVQAFWADPLVDAIHWELSPNRGEDWTPPDECDFLAAGNFYGLGPGVYPIRKCPPPPHSFDRCERVPRIRRFDHIGEPKPNPELVRSPLDADVPFPRPGRITKNAVERARGAAWDAIQVGASISIT